MPLRTLLRYLANNEQLIQKLAESYPIRRAAQLTAYFFHKGKEMGEDHLEKIRESDAFNRLQDEAKHSATKVQQKTNNAGQRVNRFLATFFNNLDEEWKKEEKRLQEQRKALEDKKDREKER